MSFKITTNNQPREIIDWLPYKELEAEFDYIDWDKVRDGKESVYFVKFKGEYYDLNDTDGVFPHDRNWWYMSEAFGFGVLFKLVDVNGKMMVVCGTYTIS